MLAARQGYEHRLVSFYEHRGHLLNVKNKSYGCAPRLLDISSAPFTLSYDLSVLFILYDASSRMKSNGASSNLGPSLPLDRSKGREEGLSLKNTYLTIN
jgi:hypothetical protein